MLAARPRSPANADSCIRAWNCDFGSTRGLLARARTNIHLDFGRHYGVTSIPLVFPVSRDEAASPWKIMGTADLAVAGIGTGVSVYEIMREP